MIQLLEHGFLGRWFDGWPVLELVQCCFDAVELSRDGEDSLRD